MDHAIRRQHIGWGRFTVQFENKITTGAILQLLVLLGGGILFLLNYEHRMTILETNATEQTRQLARYDQQFQMIQQQLQGRVVPATTPP